MDSLLLWIGLGVLVVVVALVYWRRQGVVEGEAIARAQTEAERGQPVTLGQGQMAQITSHIQAGRKIEAIKLYRDFTGEGLKEAKDAVEAIERGERPFLSAYGATAVRQPAGDVMAQVEQELRANRKINAVKLYREAHQVGLKEAKDAVDALERQLGIR